MSSSVMATAAATRPAAGDGDRAGCTSRSEAGGSGIAWGMRDAGHEPGALPEARKAIAALLAQPLRSLVNVEWPVAGISRSLRRCSRARSVRPVRRGCAGRLRLRGSASGPRIPRSAGAVAAWSRASRDRSRSEPCGRCSCGRERCREPGRQVREPVRRAWRAGRPAASPPSMGARSRCRRSPRTTATRLPKSSTSRRSPCEDGEAFGEELGRSCRREVLCQPRERDGSPVGRGGDRGGHQVAQRGIQVDQAEQREDARFGDGRARAGGLVVEDVRTDRPLGEPRQHARQRFIGVTGEGAARPVPADGVVEHPREGASRGDPERAVPAERGRRVEHHAREPWGCSCAYMPATRAP